MASYCSENNVFETFLYLLAYFGGILLFLHVINLCGPLDKLVARLGEDAYSYWMTYELNYSPNARRDTKRFICIKIKLSRLEKSGERNNGYLRKLGNGVNYSMGSSGVLFPGGFDMSPIGCLTCGKLSCGCKCWRLTPGLFEDFLYFLFNNHGLLSTLGAEKDNPYNRTERNFAFFGLGCLTFFGSVIAQIVKFSDTEGVAWDIFFIGFLNFLLTNIFYVLFSCTFLFHPTEAHRTETVVHYIFRVTLSWIGSMLGILLALGIGLILLLVSSIACGGRGRNLISFTLSSQLVGVGFDFLFILMQYIPLVIHIKEIPCIGSRTLTGSWFRERYLHHFYRNPEKLFIAEDGINPMPRDQRGTAVKVPVFKHEAVPEAQQRAAAQELCDSKSRKRKKNFCYVQLNFCKCCCCRCICCPYITFWIDKEDDVDPADRCSDTTAEFNLFDIY